MSDGSLPIGKITEQPLSNTAFTPDGTLVDDPVVLVDGNALVGSQVTPIPDQKTFTQSNAPQTKINPNR